MARTHSRSGISVGLALFAFAGVALSACSGGGGHTTPTAPGGGGSQSHQHVAVSMKIKVAQTSQQAKGQQTKGQLKGHVRYPKYVSPATNGVAITVFPTGQQQPSQPTVVVDVSGDSNSPCVINADGTRTCTISFQAQTGLDSFAVSAYDQAPVNNQIPSSANLLSAGTVANQEILQGVVNTVAITLAGQVKSLAFAPPVLLGVANNQAQSYPLSVEALDADGYIIIPLVGQSPYNNGGGQNISAGVTSGDPTHQVTLTPPTPSDPTLFTLNYTGVPVSDVVLEAVLPGVPSTTGNFTPMNTSPSTLTLSLASKGQPLTTATVTEQTALSTAPVGASIANGSPQCAVTPSTVTPVSPGAAVSFTVTAVNSGTCTVNLGTYTSAQAVTAGIPVTINGTSAGLGIGGGKIKHVVVILQENRSFDNIFGGLDNNGKPLPGADTAANPTDGQHVPHDHLGNVVVLKSLPMGVPSCYNPGHEHPNQYEDIDGGKMDGFDLTPPVPISPCVSNTAPPPAPTDWVYQTIQYSDVQPYWEMAEQYAIADHHFEAISSASYSEHLVLVSGTNGGLIDNPEINSQNPGWGCDDNAQSTTVNLYDPTNPGSGGVPGPFPCFNWPTFGDLLTAHGINWAYYAAAYAPVKPDFGYQWSSLDSFEQDRYGPIWQNNVVPFDNPIQFISDVGNGKLAAFTYITPLLATSDHPRSGTNNGPPYVASLVNAVGQSKFWSSTAIFILWDDFGGMYDHIPPPYWPNQNPSPNDPSGPGPGQLPAYGLRTGLIAVSPWVKRHSVFKSHTSSAMVLKFAEEVLNIPSLGGYDTDPNAADLSGMFDFNQPPNFSFTPFSQQYSKQQLKKLSKKPGGPPDDY